MSEETPTPAPNQPEPGQPAPKKRRPILWVCAGFAILICLLVAALAIWMNSDRFSSMVRSRLETEITRATGARTEIGAFHWSLRHLEADADNIVLHGNEPAGEAPYASIAHLHVGVSILGFLSPHIHLRSLIIEQPHIHLIVYPDQTTNAPRPPAPAKHSKSGLDTFFNLKANRIAVENGVFDFDNRAEAFDYQSRYIPFDFEAGNTSLLLQYVAANGKNPESYHIEAGIANLDLARGKQRNKPQVQGIIQASLDLTRSAAYLRSMRITAHARGAADHTLEITGALTNFAHPQWQAKLAGDLDLDLLDPTLGYPDAPQGLAHMTLTASGTSRSFRIEGPIHVEHASYIGTGVNARDLDVTATALADNNELHISHALVRPHQGGLIEADVLLTRWLPLPPNASLEAAPEAPEHKRFDFLSRLRKKQEAALPPVPKSHSKLVEEPPPILHPNGKITANLRGVSLDTVLDFVSRPPFQRLGISAILNGPAEATWTFGDIQSLTVHTALSASAPIQTPAGEAPANGTVDATYAQRDGSVTLKTLVLTLPATQLTAHGHIGAYPLTSATSLNVDCTSRNLGEFNTVLGDLGLSHDGKTGVAALPVALHGEGEFHVLWAGSLVSPRITGNLKAHKIGLEIPEEESAATQSPTPRPAPHWITWDEADAQGSYDAAHITILHSHLQRGSEQIVLDGTLTAAQPATRPHKISTGRPEFNSSSQLHAHIRATQLALADLLPVLGVHAPITGTLDTQLEADGPLSSLSGSGSAQLTNAVIHGEPISHVSAQGSLANHVLNLTSLTAQSAAGTVAASGSYNLQSGQFNGQAHGNNIDLTKVQSLDLIDSSVSGNLTFTATASGTRNDPQITGHAAIAGIQIQGKPLGSANLTAHTANHALVYDLTSHTATADAQLHGQTELHGDFPTQAQATFAHFNIGAVLKMARIESITAESALSGAATVSGPLAHPSQMRGDLRLDQAAAVIAGVQLHSEGPIHATLANSRVQLDPVHILGDQTDLRAHGTLDLTGEKQLDIAANGSVNLKLAETLDRDVTADGVTTFQVEAHGSIANPQLRGQIEFQDGSLALEDLPNGLSHIQGTLEFNQNRLEVRNLTAMTGGGQLTFGGYLAYQHGIYSDLTLTGKNIRIRYPQGISSLADTSLHLQGTQQNLLLSGNVLITRFTVSPDLDLAALASQTNSIQTIAPPNAPTNHIRLDVHIQSSPQLNFQNAYAKLAGDVDLHLRGTAATPSLIGRISITEGSANIAGTRYDLQRGEITFSNPVRIQPNIDLTATARVEDYDITLSMNGTPDRPNISFRSDPPLPESDVLALLAVGRTQSETGIYTQQQQLTAQSNTTDVLLGGALNATVSSRVQKLFGAGSVKVDPSYLGALGNSTTRITVEEQLGRYVTLTWATNVDTSSQQLLQAEIAINRHVSVLVERDESGVFSMVLKNTRRYR